MKRLLATLLAGILLLPCFTAMTGCTQDNGDTLIVWSFTDELKQMIEDYYLRDFPEKKVKVEVYPHDIFQTKLDGVLNVKTNVPDVIALEVEFVKKYIMKGSLMSLSSDGLDLESKAAQNLYGYTLDIGRAADDRLMALSWQASPGGFYYKRSVAEEVWGQSDPAFVQSKLNTLENFMRAAAEMKDYEKLYPAKGKKRILSSLHGASRLFLSMREHGWIEDNQFYFDPAMEQYFEFIRNLQDGITGTDAARGLYVNETVEFEAPWFSDMSSTDTLGLFLPPSGKQYYLKRHAGETYGDWGLVKGPVEFFSGGTFLTAYKESKKAAGIKHLMDYLCFNETYLTEYVQDTAEFVSNKNVINAIKNDYSEEFLGGQNPYEVLAPLAENIDAKTITAYDSSIYALLLTVSTDYALKVQGNRTMAEAVANFKMYVKEQYPSVKGL